MLADVLHGSNTDVSRVTRATFWSARPSVCSNHPLPFSVVFVVRTHSSCKAWHTTMAANCRFPTPCMATRFLVSGACLVWALFRHEKAVRVPRERLKQTGRKDTVLQDNRRPTKGAVHSTWTSGISISNRHVTGKIPSFRRTIGSRRDFLAQTCRKYERY